jgi:competence protein ComEC
MPPSLLRAYAMVLVGWLALLFGVELLSFSFLAVCGVALLALFPGLGLSIGFWLSVAGVFFIYLFLQYTRSWPAWAIFLGLNLWVYLAMLPVVHAIFPLFSPWQILSPLLTLLFTVFYPLSMVLHLLGWGGAMDGWLHALLTLPSARSVVTFKTPLWLLVLFLALSLLAVRHRVALYLQAAVAGLFFVYLVQLVA